MEKKHRSPSFPQMGLGEAIERLTVLYKAIGTHMTSREVVAKGLGYSGVSGPSATVIGTLTRYGLLEGRGDEIKISNVAMAILRPHSEQEKIDAVRTAARSPELFQDLGEKFPGSAPGNELLRNYLIRRGFSEQAADIAILAYKETLEFAGESGGRYDSASDPGKGADTMQTSTTQDALTPKKTPPSADRQDDEEEEVVGIGFKGVGSVTIKSSPGLGTKKALELAEKAIAMMREQLAEKEAASAVQEKKDSDNEQIA